MVLRPLHILFAIFLFLFSLDAVFLVRNHNLKEEYISQQSSVDNVVAALGLTDLCISTEARYTRHPAVTDAMAPFMDHPGAIEHFPTGVFWAPPESFGQSGKE